MSKYSMFFTGFVLSLVGVACAPPSPGGDECVNTCEYRNDGDCDDGRPGSDYDLCPYGTDDNDCEATCGGDGPTDGSCRSPGDDCTSTSDCCQGTCVRDTYQCHDNCVVNSDCNSGCCVPLIEGGAVCAAPSFCS